MSNNIEKVTKEWPTFHWEVTSKPHDDGGHWVTIVAIFKEGLKKSSLLFSSDGVEGVEEAKKRLLDLMVEDFKLGESDRERELREEDERRLAAQEAILPIVNFVYEVKVELRYTREEIDLLMKWSKEHYDRKCREFSAPGGLLDTMERRLRDWVEGGPDKEFETEVISMRDLGFLCKITEPIVNRDIVKLPLHYRLSDHLREANEKYREVNAHWVPPLRG